MFHPTTFLAFLFLPLLASAQQPLYAQCGGLGWIGGTTCVSGAICRWLNDYFSQCLSGSTTTPVPTPVSTPISTVPAPTGTAVPAAGNPYTGYTVYLSPNYADEIQAAAALISDATLKAKALKVADIPTFTWFATIAKTATLGAYLADASAKGKASRQKYLVQIVVYDLPDRDCSILASTGEFAIANDGISKYFSYIDQLVAQIKKYPDVRVVAIVEPDSLANLVTNAAVAKCTAATAAYKAGVVYALKQLHSAGVYMYLDAAHAGRLGWPADLTPAAQLFAQVYRDAGSPAFVRGLATNVANYNALFASNPDPVTEGNANYDEIHYINALTPVLTSGGFPAHFIVDQSRSGVQNIRGAWDDWCNVKGAGFGMRPTLDTGSPLVDAVVWVKPGGESDGTSNTSSPWYDPHCGLVDAAPDAPEAGTWFQAYFETLVKNANPAL